MTEEEYMDFLERLFVISELWKLTPEQLRTDEIYQRWLVRTGRSDFNL